MIHLVLKNTGIIVLLIRERKANGFLFRTMMCVLLKDGDTFANTSYNNMLVRTLLTSHRTV